MIPITPATEFTPEKYTELAAKLIGTDRPLGVVLTELYSFDYHVFIKANIRHNLLDLVKQCAECRYWKSPGEFGSDGLDYLCLQCSLKDKEVNYGERA